MAADKDAAVASTAPLSDASILNHTPSPHDTKPTNITLAQRGTTADNGSIAQTQEEETRRNRTLLTAKEEKALLRRIDWRIMTICSILFLLKNIDADNISNARITNRGTDQNIMTQLNMTSDQYNLLNVLYYVWQFHHSISDPRLLIVPIGAIHRIRSPIQLATQEVQAQCLAIEDHDLLGHCTARTCWCS